MKKTAMKVFAIIIALCVLLGAFPLSVSAYSADITASQTVNINVEGRQNNYGFVWQNKATILNNREGATVNNNHSSGYIENNYGTVGTKETSYNYGSPGNDGIILNNYGTLTYNYSSGTLYYNYGNFTETNFGFLLDNKKGAYLYCNQGIMRDNLGTMDYNVLDGTLDHNIGVITVVNTGTINYNLGTVQKNGLDYNISPKEIGIVEENSGTIVLNEKYGEINDNNGIVTTNKGYVRNLSGGIVTANTEDGRVYNYGGTVTSNSGEHYLQADLTVTNATTVYGEGFSSDNGIDCWMLEGTSGTAVITPDEDFAIDDIHVGGNIISAVENDDSSWTVTVGNLNANTNAEALGITVSPLPDRYTVTVDCGNLGEDIILEVLRGETVFNALNNAGVFEKLDAMETEDYLFRDLATKPLSEFADADEFGADAEALLDMSVTSDMTVYACFYTKIRTVSLTLTQPVVGLTVTVDDEYNQTPAPVITLPDDAHCSVSEGSAVWSVTDGEGVSSIFSGSFEEDQTYYAECMLTPDFGYWLDDNTVVTANGAQVEESSGRMALYVLLSTEAAAEDIPLLGDADGDGVITILDATVIQRYLASFAVKNPEIVEERGDISGNGLDIIDATLIQRHLAGFTVPYEIGKPIHKDSSVEEDFSYLNNKPSCPECGSGDVAYIMYGYPLPEEYYSTAFRQRLADGEIVFGGCVIDPDSPKWHCNNCGHGIN